jgi:hypothetical protein
MSFKQMAALVLAFVVSAQAIPAFAGAGSWNGSVTGPTLYQTNLVYNSNTASPPVATPSTAQVTALTWSVTESYTPSGDSLALVGSTCGCGWGLTSLSGYGSYSGASADQPFYFEFEVGVRGAMEQ